MASTWKTVVKGARDALLRPLLVEEQAHTALAQRLLLLQYRQLLQRQEPLPAWRDAGFSVYSDADEDGLLLYVFAVIGTTDRRLIDIGASGITASNSANLLVHHGWTGLLVDGDAAALESAGAFYRANRATRLYPPALVSRWVTAETVDSVLGEHGYTGEVDLLTIDIDGVDYWIWKAITTVRPRVVMIECQDIIPPDRALTVPYRPDFRASDYEVNRTTNDYVGASLLALAKLGRDKGFRLVGCNRYGWNAVFVREDLAPEGLPAVDVASCLTHPWNDYGRRERFPRVAGMDWVQV